MSTPIFKNKENRLANLADVGKTWISRSTAVVAMIVAHYNNVTYVLMNKRGPAAPDNVGKWVLPCGYLDYDETLDEAARRETWEETGVNVLTLSEFGSSNFADGQPLFTASTPKDERQNVSHYFKAEHKGSLPETSTDYCLLGEVDEVRWVPLSEVDNLDVAFGHEVRIKKFCSQ